MKRLGWLSLFAATAAFAGDTLKVFSDKGSFFVPSDKANPLAVGAELEMSTDAAFTRVTGGAIVMEVTGALARVTLDEEAAAAKARFARRAPGPAAGPQPAPGGKRARLKGKLESGIRVLVQNESDLKWTDCELNYDDGRFFKLGDLGPHSEDTVLFAFFKRPPPPPEPLYDHVAVTCDEGKSKFMFADPHSGAQLKGYAENAGGGRVTVHNSSDADWHRCNLVKPDGTHYMTDQLKAKDQDSIRPGLFVKEKEPDAPPTTRLDLHCAQGDLSVKL